MIEPLAREKLWFITGTMEGETFQQESQLEFLERIKQLQVKLKDILRTNESVLLVAHILVIKVLTSLDENGDVTKEGLSFRNAQFGSYELP
jgi:broad specificity phosphatase PhoE